jgi:cytoskeletal protein RodZ
MQEKYLREKRSGKEKEKESVTEKARFGPAKVLAEGFGVPKSAADWKVKDTFHLPGIKSHAPQKSILSSKVFWAVSVLAVVAVIYLILPAMENSQPPASPQPTQLYPEPYPEKALPQGIADSPGGPGTFQEPGVVSQPPRGQAANPPAVSPDTGGTITEKNMQMRSAESVTAAKDNMVEYSAAAGKKHTLQVDATDKVWVKVVIDGREKRESLLRRGDKVSYGANETIALTVGNAAGARIHFDGKFFENLGAEGKVVKLIFPSADFTHESSPATDLPAPSDMPDNSKR